MTSDSFTDVGGVLTEEKSEYLDCLDVSSLQMAIFTDLIKKDEEFWAKYLQSVKQKSNKITDQMKKWL